MQNFKLSFAVEMNRTTLGFRLPISFWRVVTVHCRDIAFAFEIAKAMIGEEVYTQRFLSRVVGVRETDDHPDLQSQNPEGTWNRVLSEMNLSLDDVEFIVEAGEQVGFRIRI